SSHRLTEEEDHQDRDDDHVHVHEEGGLRCGRQEDPFVLQLESDRVDRPKDPDEGLAEHARIQAPNCRDDRQPPEGADAHTRQRGDDANSLRSELPWWWFWSPSRSRSSTTSINPRCASPPRTRPRTRSSSGLRLL